MGGFSKEVLQKSLSPSAGSLSAIDGYNRGASDLESRMRVVRDYLYESAQVEAARPAFLPVKGYITGGMGTREDPFTRARELSPKDFNLKSAEAYLDILSGHRQQAEATRAEIERLAIRNLPFASQAAGLHAALGHKDSALEWLERAQFHHEGAVIWMQVDPRFDSLREEPRFKDLLRRMGLGAAQRSGG